MQIAKKQHIFLSIIAFCASLLLEPLSTSAQIVNIPDANLRAAINEMRGKPENARITHEEMQTLTELEADNRGITDLTGLETATNLRGLALRDNLISDLTPLANLTRLQQLALGGNVISDLSPLAENQGLTWIDLSNNFITDPTPLTNLDNLNWIGLTHNTISDETVFDRFASGTAITHSNFVNTIFPEAGPKIEGPWLWVIVPGTLLHKNTDLIAKATGGAATEIKIATFGATEGKAVGDSEWEAHTLAPTGGDNLNEMTDALGWGFGSEIYGHIVYGSVTLNSPQKAGDDYARRQRRCCESLAQRRISSLQLCRSL